MADTPAPSDGDGKPPVPRYRPPRPSRPLCPPPPKKWSGPDHFIALRVPLDTHAAPLFARAHAALTSADPAAARHCLAAATAHITLAVLRLEAPLAPADDGTCSLDAARGALASAARAIGGPITFDVVPELRQFSGGRVAYLPAAGDKLATAAAAMEAALAAVGLGRGAGERGAVAAGAADVADADAADPPPPSRRRSTPSFTPHVTVAKLAWTGRPPPRGGLPVRAAAARAPFDGLDPLPPVTATELLLCPIGSAGGCADRPPGEFAYTIVHSEAL